MVVVHHSCTLVVVGPSITQFLLIILITCRLSLKCFDYCSSFMCYNDCSISFRYFCHCNLFFGLVVYCFNYLVFKCFGYIVHDSSILVIVHHSSSYSSFIRVPCYCILVFLVAIETFWFMFFIHVFWSTCLHLFKCWLHRYVFYFHHFCLFMSFNSLSCFLRVRHSSNCSSFIYVPCYIMIFLVATDVHWFALVI